MSIEVPLALLESAREWDQLRPHDRAELGRALRRLGLSYGEIRRLIPVPKSTLSGWCASIVLSQEQIVAMAARTGSPKGVPRDTQWRRRAQIADIRSAAVAEVPTLLREPLWAAGTAMYWAEGAKKSKRLSMTNSDPKALRLFIQWTRTYLRRDAEFVLSLHLHHGNSQADAQRYWRHALGLPEVTFYKAYIKPPGTGHRKNHLPHGVCRVTVRASADLLVRAATWFSHLPEALDL